MTITKIILIVSGLFIFQFNGYANDIESIEPADQYVLKIDDHEYPVELNKPNQLSVELSNPEVLLKVNPYKTFKYGGVFFEYPRHYTFEADLENPDYKMWILSGNDAKILIQNYQTSIGHKYFAKILIDNYGKKNCNLEKCEINISRRTFQGSNVLAKIAGNTISQKIFSFKTKNGTTLLILQDSLSDKGEFSKEGIALTEIIEKYFKIM